MDTITIKLVDGSAAGDLALVKLLVSQGGNVTADDNCAVRWASYSGHLDTVKYLVSQGADVNNKRM